MRANNKDIRRSNIVLVNFEQISAKVKLNQYFVLEPLSSQIEIKYVNTKTKKKKYFQERHFQGLIQANLGVVYRVWAFDFGQCPN